MTPSPEMPPLGLGCAALGNLYAAVGEADAAATLERAWELGVTYFDTAPYYGHGLSETRLGAFLSAGGRGRAVVSSKVGRGLRTAPGGLSYDTGFVGAAPFEPYFDYSRDGVLRQMEESLVRLGRDRLELVFIHDIGALTHGTDHPARLTQALGGALPALQGLRDQGVVGAIGIGVNEVDVCLEVLGRADLDVILLAGRYTLLDQSAAQELLPKCERRGVSVIVGGPFNSGILVGGSRFDYQPATPAILGRVERLRSICAAHGATLTAAALAFPLRHPAVTSVIPGARSVHEVEANVVAFGAPPPEGLWRELEAERLVDEIAP